MSEINSKVWSTLELKKKDGTTVKMRFQEPPPERVEEAYDLLTKYLLTDEVIYRSSGVYKNEEAIEEYNMVLNKLVEVSQPHITICCVDDGTAKGGEIAAVSVITLDKMTDSISEFLKHFQVKTVELQKLFKAAQVLEEVENLSKQYELHYHGKGIVVHPDYRGMGIANEIVRLRRIVCEENDIPMSCAWMTAKGSQRAAGNSNWYTYIQLDPQEFGAKTGLSFAANTLPFKLMYVTKD